MKHNVIFPLFSLSFCYIIVMSKQKRILSFFGRENKREEHRPQTETSRTDNIDKDKLSDTDEREPFVELKAKASKRNFQSTWLKKFKWLRHDNTKSMLCLICIGSSKANLFISGCINFRTLTLTRHEESHYADLTFFFNFSKAKNSVSPKKLECPLEKRWLGQIVPLKWNPRSDTVTKFLCERKSSMFCDRLNDNLYRESTVFS